MYRILLNIIQDPTTSKFVGKEKTFGDAMLPVYHKGLICICKKKMHFSFRSIKLFIK